MHPAEDLLSPPGKGRLGLFTVYRGHKKQDGGGREEQAVDERQHQWKMGGRTRRLGRR